MSFSLEPAPLPVWPQIDRPPPVHGVCRDRRPGTGLGGAAAVRRCWRASCLVLGATTIWANPLVWGGAAFVLAICAYIGHRRKRRKAHRTTQTLVLASDA